MYYVPKSTDAYPPGLDGFGWLGDAYSAYQKEQQRFGRDQAKSKGGGGSGGETRGYNVGVPEGGTTGGGIEHGYDAGARGPAKEDSFERRSKDSEWAREQASTRQWVEKPADQALRDKIGGGGGNTQRDQAIKQKQEQAQREQNQRQQQKPAAPAGGAAAGGAQGRLPAGARPDPGQGNVQQGGARWKEGGQWKGGTPGGSIVSVGDLNRRGPPPRPGMFNQGGFDPNSTDWTQFLR